MSASDKDYAPVIDRKLIRRHCSLSGLLHQQERGTGRHVNSWALNDVRLEYELATDDARRSAVQGCRWRFSKTTVLLRYVVEGAA